MANLTLTRQKKVTMSRENLIGDWVRQEVLEDGSQELEQASMTEDGQYQFDFSTYDQQGNLLEHTSEFGFWGLVGDIHFTVAKVQIVNDKEYVLDPTDEEHYQVYKVLELTGQKFKYQHIVSNEVFILKRVIDRIAHC